MRKIFLMSILSSLLFSCRVTLENKKGVIKIDRDDFELLFVPAKYYNVVDLERVIYSSNAQIQFGKAEDINFINHNLKYLRNYGILNKDMYIFRPDSYGRQIHPTTSNFLLTREDSLNPFDISKKFKAYFIMRRY